MHKLKALIVDDEIMSIRLLEQIINKYFTQFELIEEAQDIYQAVEKINKNQHDIIFLDIEMPNGSGFELLKNFPKHNFKVIFITAFDQFAVKAFKENAIDYLLKPINELELVSAINKARDQIIMQDFYTENQNKQLAEQIAQKTTRIIEFVSMDCIEYVDPKDIIRCEASGNYTSIFLADNRKLFISKLLVDIETLISQPNFFRSHKSHLINLNHIVKYIKSDACIVMNDGENVPLSRKKKTEFFDKMQNIIS